ncbi:restriction endonuclease subunit S [Vibrio cholerae]|nr:restriction endonuclease subunit S [Vibrio cholerae]EKF9273406.1 restriction endonuclease subunit S [Vibrio cholerae]EKF9890418.1 restriction endonuclease subunit S [Vibrio cholerae]
MVIPASWKQSELGEVLLSILGGGTPSKSNPSFYEGDIPWMSVKDMNKNILNDTVDHISEEAVENSSTNVIPSGTPIIATRMSLGKIVVANFDSAINQDLKALFPATGVNRDFLIGWYRSIAKKIEALGTGTTVKGIRLEVLNSLEFPLPPLAEQKVIADKLDTLLAQVETSKARLERIPQILKTFRQSVLAAAVSGKLTEEWRGDNKASSTPTRLKAITAIAGGKTPSKSNSSYWESGDIPWVSPKDMKIDLIADSQDKITKEAIDSGGMKLVPSNSILVVTRSGILAHSFPVAKTSVPVTINQDIKALVPNLGFISPEFLFYLLKGLERRILDECTKAGTTVSSVETSLLMNLEFELPSLEEQTEIVRRVEELFAFADRIEQKANAALERVNNLTQSILAKAFRGELTADWRAANPDLITGENSAEALLKKIKAEREALKKQPKTKSTVKKKTGSRMSKQIIKVVDALKEAGKPLKGQQLLAAAGYPSDSSTDLLEQFFLDIREALTAEKSIVKLERSDDGQDWFALAGTAETNKA